MNAGLKIAGLGVAGLLGLSLYYKARRAKRDKLATKLIREVTKLVNPATAGLLAEDAFDIHFKHKVLEKVRGKILVLKSYKAKQHAERIYDAWSFWGDDESQVYSVFRQLRDKVQVSQVARAYQDAYGDNLIDKLNDKMDDEEVETILKIVRPLPAYRKA